MSARGEQELVAAARKGDVQAFEALISPYEGRLYQLLLRMLGSEADAEDLLQETLVRGYERLEAFEGRSAFATWLHRIAVNQALMHLRRKGADLSRPSGDPLRFNWMDGHADRVRDWSRSPEDEALRSEARRVLAEAIDALPEIDRAIVLMKDAEGLSHEAIAEATRLTPLAARSRLHRARLLLRDRLSRYFLEAHEGHLGKDVQGSRRSVARLLGRLFGS